MSDNNRVSAAEFVRNFARYRDAALSSPVIVTNHGRETHALLSIAEFEARSAGAAQPNDMFGPASLEILSSFANWISEALFVVDSELMVNAVNQQAELMIKVPANEILGRHVHELHPKLGGSVVESLIRRTVNTGQPSEADFPSFFRENQWTHMRCFPWGDKTFALFRDITEEVTSYRLADVKQAILDAMDCHGGIAYARLSPRGTIDRCDNVLVEKLGLPSDRLIALPFVDLLDLKDRPLFKEALEKCLRSNGCERLDVQMLSNDGSLLKARTGLQGLHGAYGVEGVITVQTFY